MAESLAPGPQTAVLARRYFAVLRGDLPTLALTIGQAPVIGGLCNLVWRSVEKDTPSLYFVLSLAAVWLGCISACREIVKERPILERERSFGLSVRSYLGSKLLVLAGVGLVQVVLLQVAVEVSLSVRGPYLLQTLALFGAQLGGVALGLLISAISHNADRAVGAVPLLLIPQILFSDFAVPSEYYTDFVEAGEKLMPVHWAYEIFSQSAATEPDWWTVLGALLVQGMMVAVLSLGAALALVPRRDV